MRQRNAPQNQQTAPRSGDSDKRRQARQRQEPRTVNTNESSLGAITAAATSSLLVEGPSLSSHQPARRRRTATLSSSGRGSNSAGIISESISQQTTPQQLLRHSPQHYLDEYKKNNGGAAAGISTAAHRISHVAPNSAGGTGTDMMMYSQTHGGQTARDIYYAQYHNHYLQQQQQQPTNDNPYLTDITNQPSPGVAIGSGAGGAGGLHRVRSAPNAHKASFQHFERSFHMNPDPLAAVHFRKALHVPDKDYEEMLLGIRKKTTPMFHPVCCANVCAGFSLIGFLFMIFIGILVDTQPLFIGGVLPETVKENDNGKTSAIHLLVDERLPMATAAYRSAVAYLLTMMACVWFVNRGRVTALNRRRMYQEVPDAQDPPGTPESTVGVVGGVRVHLGGESGSVLPGEYADNSEYYVSPWNRIASAAETVKLREWAGSATARIWNGRADNRGSRKTRKKNAKTI